MKMKFGIKEVVATGIGTALFVALTEVQIPLGFIPNTALQPRAALLAFLAAVFGPVVGGMSVFWDMQSVMHCFMEAYGGAGYSQMRYSVFWSDFSLQNMRSRTADSRRNRSCCSTLCRLLPTSLHG